MERTGKWARCHLWAIAVVMLGCGANETKPNAETRAAPSLIAATADLPMAPDFKVTMYQGMNVVGGDRPTFGEILARGKPVVLNFWAGSCPPCRMEMPEFEQVSVERASDVTILGIDIGPFIGLGTREEGQALLMNLGVTYLAGTTDDPAIVTDYQVFGMPTTIFVTSDGRMTRRWTGILNAEKLGELVDELVAVFAPR